MNKKLNKKLLVLAITTLTFLTLFSGFNTIAQEDTKEIVDIFEEKTTDGSKGTHTALAEYGTATWCGYCKYAHAAFKNIWAAGTQDFYYVIFVNDMNSYCGQRMTEYNLYGYPTAWFDGGYQVVVGAGSTPAAEANYNNAIDNCEARTVYDVDAQLSVQWLGNAAMNIDVSVQNNEATTYDGHIRVYVTEIVSSLGWTDTNGYPYTFAFLNYAFNQDISISSGNTWSSSTVWDGNNYGFGSITDDNIMVIAAVFNDDWHQGYSYPPSSNPFNAYYVDETVGAVPNLDMGPPEISNVYATPSISIPYENMDIYADVIDDAGIDEVRVIIETPQGGLTNGTMTLDSGNTYRRELTWISLVGTYNYYIWSKDINGNQNTSDVYTFEVMDPAISSLENNWNFVALALNATIDKTDIIVYYSGTDHTWAQAVSDGVVSDYIFGWNRISQSYAFADELIPGEGYWIFAIQTCDLKTPVMSANYDNFITTLDDNWNVIGSSYCETFLKDDITVHYSGTDHTWAHAVTAGMVSDYIFGWNRLSQSYAFADELVPGEAFWVFGTQDCSLYRP